jgi:nitrate reductase cytochrome c-type subunit
MKHKLLIFASSLLFVWMFSPSALRGEQAPVKPPKNKEANAACLQCHGEKKYKLYNSDSSSFVIRTISEYGYIDKNLFYHDRSVHRDFSCFDCHAEGYNTFPHPVDLRFEYINQCIDCHGGDEKYAKFNFESIEAEYMESIHHGTLEEKFSCWSCHNPHGYVVHARNDKDILEVVQYNNNVCLSCHANVDKFSLLTEHKLIEVVPNHDWLPNQELHFKQVRCIDCHTKISETSMVAHLIQGKELAVHNCEECHSQNSRLMSTLYKFRVKERREQGFLNSVITNQAYIIGANRNVILNQISLGAFFLLIGVLFIHFIFRVISK